MTDFESITQYDKSFDNLFLNINHKGYACGFFSIYTAYMFLDTGRFTKNTHENCIKNAINFTIMKKIHMGLNFDELVEKTCNLNKKNICSTSVELIRENIIGYDQIFENKENKPYSIIFLKNEKYFVVLYDNNTNLYYVRDCHNNTQKTLKYESLKKYLKDSYQFEEDINLLGTEYANYSSIEYLKIYNTFSCNLISAKPKVKLDVFEYNNQEKIYTDDNLVYF